MAKVFKYTAENLRDMLFGKTNEAAKQVLEEIADLENLHLVEIDDETNTLMLQEEERKPPIKVKKAKPKETDK